jgi:hypothetical protein
VADQQLAQVHRGLGRGVAVEDVVRDGQLAAGQAAQA